MSTHVVRLILSVCLALASLTLACGQPAAEGGKPAAKEGQARTDQLGDPLPEGAVARLGTTRFRRLDQWEFFLGFIADGTRMVFLGDAGRQLRYRDLRTYKLVHQARPALTSYPHFARSNDGTRVVFLKAGDLSLAELTTGKEVGLAPAKELLVRPGRENGVHGLTYRLSRDCRLLAVAGEEDKKAHLISWLDTTTGKCLHRARSREGGIITSLAFTRDGKALAAVEQDPALGNNWLRVWDVASGKELSAAPLPHDARLNSLFSFLPDGKFLLGTGRWNGPLLLCDAATGQTVRTFAAKGDEATHYDLSADGKTLFGSIVGLIRIWDVGTGRILRELRLGSHYNEAPQLHLSPDGNTLVAVGQHHLTLWDARTGKQLHATAGHSREVSSLSFSPAGDRLASSGVTPGAILWDVASGKELARLMPTAPKPSGDGRVLFGSNDNNWLRHSPPAAQALFAPDGKCVATVWPDHPVQLWRADTGKLLHTLGVEKAYQTLAFAAGGQLLAAADQDGEIRLWGTASGKKLDALLARGSRKYAPGAAKAATALTSSADGKSLAAARFVYEEKAFKMRIRHWEVATRAQRRCLEVAAASRLSSLGAMQHVYNSTSYELDFRLCFCPNGRLLALADGHVIYLWDAKTGKEVRQFAGPELLARTLAFSPDGKLLAAGRSDGHIRLWRVDTGTVLRDLPAHDQAVTALAFSPDGRLLASGARDTTILLWDAHALSREVPTP